MKPLADLAVYDDADFYDQEFAARTHDIPFFLGQAVRAGGPVLEAACGTGRPGGTLILDVFNPDMAKLCRLPESPYHHKSVVDRDGARLDVRATTGYDAAAQVLRFALDYLRDGVCVLTKKVSMRCFFPEELLALCRLAGLDVAQRYGDYDQSPFMSTSPKQLLFCRSQTANGRIGDPRSVPVVHPS
jgi:hypothetical protein